MEGERGRADVVYVRVQFKGYHPERRCKWKRLVGMKLENLVIEALKQMGLFEQFTYYPDGKVDFVWDVEGWEIECKRFRKTKYVTVAWLRDEVVSRFSYTAVKKVLVVTKKIWGDECERYLKENKVSVIVVGRIDSWSEEEAAIKKFQEQFLNLIAEDEPEVEVVEVKV